jgi:hypothetical protein
MPVIEKIDCKMKPAELRLRNKKAGSIRAGVFVAIELKKTQ